MLPCSLTAWPVQGALTAPRAQLSRLAALKVFTVPSSISRCRAHPLPSATKRAVTSCLTALPAPLATAAKRVHSLPLSALSALSTATVRPARCRQHDVQAARIAMRWVVAQRPTALPAHLATFVQDSTIPCSKTRARLAPTARVARPFRPSALQAITAQKSRRSLWPARVATTARPDLNGLCPVRPITTARHSAARPAFAQPATVACQVPPLRQTSAQMWPRPAKPVLQAQQAPIQRARHVCRVKRDIFVRNVVVQAQNWPVCSVSIILRL